MKVIAHAEHHDQRVATFKPLFVIIISFWPAAVEGEVMSTFNCAPLKYLLDTGYRGGEYKVHGLVLKLCVSLGHEYLSSESRLVY